MVWYPYCVDPRDLRVWLELKESRKLSLSWTGLTRSDPSTSNASWPRGHRRKNSSMISQPSPVTPHLSRTRWKCSRSSLRSLALTTLVDAKPFFSERGFIYLLIYDILYLLWEPNNGITTRSPIFCPRQKSRGLCDGCDRVVCLSSATLDMLVMLLPFAYIFCGTYENYIAVGWG